MANSDFSKQVVEVIAKRAANICSNPDCAVATCGPAEDGVRAVTIGEAAHIFGARESSARFDAAMSDTERSDITNAIWLCRNCHKMVDADPTYYPAEMLFEWRRLHEVEIAKRLGKPSELIRQKVIEQQLSAFSSVSYLARQIIIDKPAFWEYKLTIELLRTRLVPVLKRWHALSRGLYVKQTSVVYDADETFAWIGARFEEITHLAEAFSKIINMELNSSWGPPGEPGKPEEILRACDLLVELAERTLEWEERARFTKLPEAFEEARGLLVGIGGRMIEQLARIPDELGRVFGQEEPTGVHHISLVIDVPEGWQTRMAEAMERLDAKLTRQ